VIARTVRSIDWPRRFQSLLGRLGGAGLMLALLAAAPAQAQILSDSEARRAILELRARVDEWQREVHLRIEGLVERIDRLEQALPRGQLDLQNNVQALRQEIAQLRGQLEVQSNELQMLQRRQKELLAELDGRIRRFEPVAVTIDGKNATVEIAEKRAFEAALATFRAGDFKGALTAFQAFATSFPSSAYAASTQYWIGSAHYALRDGKSALTSLESFAKRFPEHPRAAEAWLTIGTVHADNGDRKEAAEAWKLVLQNYPDSSAAAPARDRLAALAASPPPEPPRPPPAAPPAPSRPATRR
jgi:tol-pal system protein YbgF